MVIIPVGLITKFCIVLEKYRNRKYMLKFMNIRVSNFYFILITEMFHDIVLINDTIYQNLVLIICL